MVEVLHRLDLVSKEEDAFVEELNRLEQQLRYRLGGRINELRVVPRGHGLALRGRSLTYYAKQLAQHAVMEATRLPLLANEIEVF